MPPLPKKSNAKKILSMNHQNEIELIGHYGSDLTHACSAWTSTSRDLTPERIERIPKLLKETLLGAKPNPHTSPFEKSALHFLVTAEQASHIHLIKHRIGVSINAESARYEELTDKWYIPAHWPEDEAKRLNEWCEQAFFEYHDCLNRLILKGVTRKRAKETARFYLPYASQIQLDIQFNWLSFAHFQRLRNEDHAQDEIHHIAEEMLRLVEGIESNPFQHTIAAFRSLGWIPTHADQATVNH